MRDHLDELLAAFLATLPTDLTPDVLTLVVKAWRAGFSAAESQAYGA